MSSFYGSEINPYNKYRERFGFKAERRHVKISHTPSTIDQNQDLEVRLPNLGKNDVIVPSSLQLTFDLNLTSTLNTRYIVNNIGRALVKKMTINFEGNEVQSIQDSNVWMLYKDNWISTKKRSRLIQQGICDEGNINKIRISAHGAEAAGSVGEKGVAKAYGNRFAIPLADFEMVKYLPFPGIGDRLSFIFQFSSYSDVIKDAGTGSGNTAKDPDGSYKISNIALEFDKIEDEGLHNAMKQEYNNMSLPYDRVLRHRIIPLKKEDTAWNIQVNVPTESLKGLALIFIDPDKRKSYDHQSETFYNPLISKVDITVEGEPNQLYSHGLLPKDMYQNALNCFGEEDTDIDVVKFLSSNYCLFIDFRSTIDNILHGTGRRLKNISDGVTLQIQKKTDGTGAIKCYVYVLQDGQINFLNGRFDSVGY